MVVHRHGRVLHERVIAIGTGAMEMSVDFIARAVVESAIDVPVVELEPVQDVYVIVEVSAVHNQYVFLIRDVKTPVLVAVIVRRA